VNEYLHHIYELFHLPCHFLDHLGGGLNNNGEQLNTFTADSEAVMLSIFI
jgi:hypothetical protein